MRAGPREREVFRHIAEVESEPRNTATSFAEALRTLEQLLARHRTMFPDYRPQPDDEEFRAHEALYERARELGASGR